MLLSAGNTFISRHLSLFSSACSGGIIMIFNRSWLGPVRSRFGGDYRYEGIRETDKRPSIFGRARVATLLSFVVTVVIFLSLVVRLERHLVSAHSSVGPAANMDTLQSFTQIPSRTPISKQPAQIKSQRPGTLVSSTSSYLQTGAMLICAKQSSAPLSSDIHPPLFTIGLKLAIRWQRSVVG